MRTTSTQWRFRTVKSNSLQHRSMTYVTDSMERILLDSLADRAATEQNRRKAVTQSRGASADPIRHASRAASVSSWRSGFVFVDRLAATPRWRGSGHDVQAQAGAPVGIAQ